MQSCISYLCDMNYRAGYLYVKTLRESFFGYLAWMCFEQSLQGFLLFTKKT